MMADPHKNVMLSSDSDDSSSGHERKPNVIGRARSKEARLAGMTSSLNYPPKLLKKTRLPAEWTPHSPFRMTGFPLGSQENEHQYKLSIIQKYESEWSFLSGEKESLSALYTEPLIIQKKENGSFTNIYPHELMGCLWYKDYSVNVLQGDSGSGKSFIAQKIMLDWASEWLFSEQLFSRPFTVVFYLRCEELMCISEEMNLFELLSYSCSLTSDQISQMLQQSPERVLFIIDGLDELRLTQDIYDMSAHIYPLQKAPPEVILFGLLRRYLIPESKLLVTTRTKNTVNKLLKGQQRVTEIMGFSASQVERYFQKFFRKEYDCVRADETLFTACSIPVICWIISEMFRVGANVTSGLKTTTSIYVDFVSTLLEHHYQGLSQSIPTLLRSLGQLAERGILEQQVLFDEKSVNETISDPAGSPFLYTILIKRIIHQETMFSFMHLSFQEFFTALYYVLLDEEESQRKVRDLLHTVERGWTLSCWSDRDFSMADVEIRHSKLLQPVILFLCGLCQKEWIPSFFEKHNIAVSIIKIETQLEEWLNQSSQRYQNEQMLFILHCLYELHEKSFIGKVLEGLILIDLSDFPLKRTDCWVLKYCLQCCEHIRNLKLHVTSENLKMLQPELYRCKELWLMMDHISDEVVDLISVAGKGKILNKLKVKKSGNLESGFCPEITVSVRDEDITLSFNKSLFTSTPTKLTLTCPSSVLSTISWGTSQKETHLKSYPYLDCEEDKLSLLTFLKSVSDVKKVCLQVSDLTDTFTPEIVSLIRACPSLTELRIICSFRLVESLKKSLKQVDWALTVWGDSVLIKPDGKFTEEELKMKKEKVEHRRSQENERQYKMSIIQKYKTEWSFLSGEKESLSALYTEPLIIQKKENGSFTNISVDELEGCLWYKHYSVNVLQGDSGSGKSFIAQRIMLDWASERLFSRHFTVVFYLRCEELMCVSEEMNLFELLSYNCSLTSDQISQMLQQSLVKVLFIIDGLDELRLTQDIYDMSAHIYPLQKAPPEVILCGLLRRYLIPESNLLVTTRTKNTVNKLQKGQQRVTEIMGFSASQVERYFQKFFRKEYDCVRANETLFTACSIPVICWIISEMFRVGANVTSGLKTTTSIYVDFVSTLLDHHYQGLSQSVPTLLRSLGQLAERGILEQQVLFDEKSVNETISDPAGSPFLYTILIKRIIHQETMFSFMRLSFQEFFTALYYVLLDEEESQRKVRDLLHTVERGWTLSCWSDRDFSMADVQIRHSKLLQSVILFLCGLCQKEWIPSFFEKHNIAVSIIKIETQLEEWLNQSSQRYQNEHMLFILHCLYELHEKSFVGKVLEGLILIDLSDIPLKRTDCWVLKYCLQCCEHIRNLKLHVTSENLKMLQPELYRCKELWLMMDHISDEVVGLISAVGKILNKLNLKQPENHESGFCPEITVSVRDEDITLSFSRSVITSLTLTCPSSVVSTINWIKSHKWTKLYSYRYLDGEEEELGLLMFLKSLSDLKKVCLQVSDLTDTFTPEIVSLIRACPSLTELRIICSFRLVESLKKSLKQVDWALTVWGNSVLIKPDGKKFTKEELKMKGESSGSGSSSSLKTESSSAQSAAVMKRTLKSSEDAEVFTPDLLQTGDEDKNEQNTYRFVCPHAGQFRCSLTNLVFVMEGEGEVLYNIVSWDPRLLDGLGQMQPAGPLYNIDCFHGSVSQLHFPHCVIFSEENKDGVAVAHFTGGNVEIIQPLKVTETHVIIDIRDLSLFGLVWIKQIFGFSISGQVLLFLGTLSLERKKLNVHLLPGNVPVSEVQCWHRHKKYIETSSKCRLFADHEYSLCCEPEECEVQPKSEMFELDSFGPNYHPTFEVFLDVSVEEVGLGILDQTAGGKEVWNRRRIFLTAPSKGAEPPEHRRIPEAEFVDTHGDELIQRVSSVMAIADSLKSKNMITSEMWGKIKAVEPQQQKMRDLLAALDSRGDTAKAEFYKLLKEKEPYLVDELESGPSRPSPQ